jgi:broad specificity phosphatase PhoE
MTQPLLLIGIIDPNKNITFEVTPFLQRLYFGEIQGKSYGNSSDLAYAINSGTGESAEDLYQRASRVLNYIHSIATQGNILIVGHGSFSSVLFAVHSGKTKDDLISYRDTWEFENGEIKIL